MRRMFIGICLALTVSCKGRQAEGGTTPAPTSEKAKPTTVVMAINLGEDEEQGGCGDVIHAVRAVAKRGVRTREIDTRNKSDMEAASKKYRIVVEPTVVLLDDSEHEVRRYEGESSDTITALKADLEQMAKS